MYEIPDNVRTRYRHWEKHTQEGGGQDIEGVEPNPAVLDEIMPFVEERMHVWHRRHQQQRPYTTDPILQQYRFCNVYRELDRQTLEIHQLLNPLRDDFSRWLLNVFFCRFVCNIQTINDVGLLSYNKKENERVYHALLHTPRPKYGSAYVFPISVIQKSEHPTRESFFCRYLPQVMEVIADEITHFNDLSVADAVEQILPLLRFNYRFHTTEVLIDVAYQYPDRINLFDRFPIGPGSEPTMRRIANAHPEQTCLQLAHRRMDGAPLLTYNGAPVVLSAENWEGIGCEFRKYTNLKNGQGRKRRYMSS